MCVSQLMFIEMANEEMNVLDVLYGADFNLSNSNPEDVSNLEYEDVFKDVDFNCSSELSSPSDEEEDSTKPLETQIRKHLVIGKHIEIIDGEQKKYKCTICKCQFAWKHQIRYHDYCVTGKRPLKCELCDKRFIKKSHLIYHTRTHSGESPYQCSVCPKKFKQLCKLKRHENIHKQPGEAEKFQCSVCEQNYCDRDSLKKHQLKHEKSKTIQCKHCKKKYADELALKHHLATHQVPKFICEVCGRRFRWKHSLNIHLQMHEDLYPHQCSQCRKTFRTKKELNQHEVVHDKGDPKFECSLCSVMFGRKDNLLRHVRNCHLDPCAKKENSPKRIIEDSSKKDVTEIQNSRNLNDTSQVKESSAITADDQTSLSGECSKTPSGQTTDCSVKTGLMNKSSSVGKKKTRSVVNKTLSSKSKGKKKGTGRLKRSETAIESTRKDNPVSSNLAGQVLGDDNPGSSNLAQQVLGDDKPSDLSEDRKSVFRTTSTITEVPVDLTKSESLITERSQENLFSSAKTSVIVHTSSLHGSLLLEANSRREPVIKFFRPSSEPKSLSSDPT